MPDHPCGTLLHRWTSHFLFSLLLQNEPSNKSPKLITAARKRQISIPKIIQLQQNPIAGLYTKNINQLLPTGKMQYMKEIFQLTIIELVTKRNKSTIKSTAMAMRSIISENTLFPNTNLFFKQKNLQICMDRSHLIYSQRAMNIYFLVNTNMFLCLCKFTDNCIRKSS